MYIPGQKGNPSFTATQPEPLFLAENTPLVPLTKIFEPLTANAPIFISEVIPFI